MFFQKCFKLLTKIRWVSGVAAIGAIITQYGVPLAIIAGWINESELKMINDFQGENWKYWATLVITVGGGVALQNAAKHSGPVTPKD